MELLNAIKNLGKEFTGENIVRTENEFSQIIRNKKLNNTIIVIDEINRMDHTGENTSTEDNFLMSYYEIMASYYVHRITCSPKGESDPNSEIYLETISINKQTGEILCHLYYNLFKGGDDQHIPLGYIRINATKTINNWKKIEEDFYKRRHETDKKWEKQIEHRRKIDYYVDYMVRKAEKYDLAISHGIYNDRRLEYAEIVKEVYTALHELMGHTNLTIDTIRNYVKKTFRDHKIPFSLLGLELATRETLGLLNIKKDYTNNCIKLKKLAQQLKKEKITVEQYDKEKMIIENITKILLNVLDSQLEELNFMIQKKKEFTPILLKDEKH